MVRPVDQSNLEERRLSVTVVGNLVVRVDNSTLGSLGKKPSALLAYIALSENTVETRDRLVGLFWSESEEVKARASLRQVLRKLRRDLKKAGYCGFTTDKVNISLDHKTVDVDLTELLRQAENGRVHDLLLEAQPLQEAFLQGYDEIDPSFHIWLLARRRTLHDRVLRSLEAAIDANLYSSNQTELIATAIINQDPSHEQAHRYLMQSRAKAGDIGGALSTYNKLWQVLDEEYDVEPSLQTQQLVADIKQGEIKNHSYPRGVETHFQPQPEEDNSGTQKDRIVLAVEPFLVEGVPKEDLHLTHGFRHALIACLVRFREWHVTEHIYPNIDAPDSVLRKAEFAVQATAYQTGGRIKVILTLLDVLHGSYVWSETFELDVENWFFAQQRIVRRLTMALNINLSAERLNRFAKEADVSPHLYDRWLRGQALILDFYPSAWQRASALFRATIRDAPHFAPAYSSLVQLSNTFHIAHPGMFRTVERQSEALTWAKTASELDPVDSRAQLCLGWALAFNRQFDQALIHFDFAVELNEHDPWTLLSAAQGHAFLANFEQAKSLSRLTLETAYLQSQANWGYHAGIRFMCADYEDAVEAAVNAGDYLVNNRAWLAASLVYLDRQQEAREHAQECMNLIKNYWCGNQKPSQLTIGCWLLHLFPIRRSHDWARLQQALQIAGVPVTAASRYPG